MLVVLLIILFTKLDAFLIAPLPDAKSFVARASEIVEAKAISSTNVEHTNFAYRVFKFQILDTVKRTYLTETQKYISVIYAGGKLGTKTLSVSGLYLPNLGQRYLLFLIRKSYGWTVASSNDGCYKIFSLDDIDRVYPCVGTISASNVFFKELSINSTDDIMGLSNMKEKIKDLAK